MNKRLKTFLVIVSIFAAIAGMAICAIVIGMKKYRVVKENDSYTIIPSTTDVNEMVYRYEDVKVYENNREIQGGLETTGVRFETAIPRLAIAGIEYGYDLDKATTTPNLSGIADTINRINTTRASRRQYATIVPANETDNEEVEYTILSGAPAALLSPEKVTEIIGRAIEMDIKSINLDACHIEDEEYIRDLNKKQEYVEKLNALYNWEITWINGERLTIEDSETIRTAVQIDIDDLEISINLPQNVEDWGGFGDFHKETQTRLENYDTVGKPKSVDTMDGEMREISGGTYGEIFDAKGEAKAVLEMFRDQVSETDRTPVMKQTVKYDPNQDRVEVSIDNQHVWYIRNNTVLWESDCVTGRKGKTDTPKGVYEILEKIPGKYLVGDDYKVWVNRWMRVTWKGVGLHDATSRRAFGGEIYKTNGSHGCINLPLNKAKELYEIIEVGIPVVIY